MARDLEEFLRRAAQRRQQGRPAEPQPPVQAEPVIPNAAAQQPPQRANADRITPTSNARTGQRKPRQNKPAAVDLADERMAAHVHDVFDHSLGELGPTESDSLLETMGGPVTPPLTAAELLHLLTTSEGIRKAVILKEILDRPEHRW